MRWLYLIPTMLFAFAIARQVQILWNTKKWEEEMVTFLIFNACMGIAIWTDGILKALLFTISASIVVRTYYRGIKK